MPAVGSGSLRNWAVASRTSVWSGGDIDLTINKAKCLMAILLRSVRVRAFGFALVLLAPIQSSVALADTGWAGAGTVTCAEFIKDTQQDPQNAHRIFASWTQGFMSGLNSQYLMSKAATDLYPANFSQDAQERLLRNYCEQHPQNEYVEAVLALWWAMRRAEGLSVP
jgi:hypothetical protein